MAVEFTPRGQDVVLGGIPWLARMIDKARACAGGYIGEYSYPCPIDRQVLAEIGYSAAEFTSLVTGCTEDEEIVIQVKARRRTVRQTANKADEEKRQCPLNGKC